ncbi:MAG: nitrilase-related carbon-nitrogen hydrolase, partial [Pseudomonadota bacterium]
PGWIVNVTNDAWFGDTPGPRQHLHQSRVRAVEQGLPVVRAANSGISAIIDSYGRVTSSLGLGLQGVVDGSLPQARSAPPFASFGNAPFLIFICIIYALSVVGCRFGDRRL